MPCRPRGRSSPVSRSITLTSMPAMGWPIVPMRLPHLSGVVIAAGRPISGHDRRQLRGPVALDRQHAEPLLEGRRQVGRELFRAGKDDVQRTKIVGLAAPQIGPQKRGRGDQDRAAVLAAEGADLPRFQRRVMVNALGIERQHRPQRGRVAEGVEHRQHAQQGIAGRKWMMPSIPLQVGADVGIGQHHALGQAGRAGGEHDRRHVVRPDRGEAQQAFQDRGRQQPGGRGGQQLVGPGHALFQFLDVDQLGVELQREAIEHPPAGQHVADAALGHAGVDQFRSDACSSD